MRHHRGHAEDKFRAQTVEPVTGQIKTGQAMTIMSRRSFGACRSDWLPAATAHNLRQLHAHRRDTEHRTHTTGRDNRGEATTGPATHPGHACPSLRATGWIMHRRLEPNLRFCRVQLVGQW